MNQIDYNDILAQSNCRQDLWAQVLSATSASDVAEVGVWRGEFSKAMLERCPTIQRYVMIDPWASQPDWNKPFNVENEVFDTIFSDAMSNTSFASEKVSVLRGRTLEMSDRIRDESLDFVYIDGDHTLRGITVDLIRMLPKVKLGGLIAGDDFIASPWQHDPEYDPTLVFPYSVFFAEAMALPITALPFNQFIIERNPDAGFSFTDLTGNYRSTSLRMLFKKSGKHPLRVFKHMLKRLV